MPALWNVLVTTCGRTKRLVTYWCQVGAENLSNIFSLLRQTCKHITPVYITGFKSECVIRSPKQHMKYK